MDQRHKEYIEYYKSRMLKYKDNSIYKNSYESEKALYEAMANASDLEEFGTRLQEGKLHIKNAIALVKDQETERAKMFREEKEFIRLQSPERILDVIDTADSESSLITMVNEIDAEVSKNISIDLFTCDFYYDFMMLENIEVYQNAEVPDEWKKEINCENPERMIEEGVKDWREQVLPNARLWDPNWNFNFELIWEERHRRLIPVPDDVIKKRIGQFKKYRGI